MTLYNAINLSTTVQCHGIVSLLSMCNAMWTGAGGAPATLRARTPDFGPGQ